MDGDGQVTFVPSLAGVASDSDYLIRTLLGTQYGDANLDGQIDVLDLDLLGQGFQDVGAGWLFGDFDGSGGRTDVLDLDLLGQTFGFDNSASSSFSQTVPEPGSIATFVISFGFLAVRLRRRSAAAERQQMAPAAVCNAIFYFAALSIMASSADADLVIDNSNRASLEIISASSPPPANGFITYSFTVSPIQPMTEISSIVASFSGTDFRQVNPTVGTTTFSTIFNDNNALFTLAGENPNGLGDSQFEFNRTVENLTVIPGSAVESSIGLAASFTGFAPIVTSRTIAHIVLPAAASGLLDLQLAVRPLGGGLAQSAIFTDVPFGPTAVPEASALSVWLLITLAAVVGTYFKCRQRTGVHQ